MSTIDDNEVGKFSRLADTWWDPDGASRPLHDLNPARTAWIAGQVPLRGRRALDVGCGGGLLCESLAREGAMVTGVDASAPLIEVAREHARLAGLGITYVAGSIEEFAASAPQPFPVITCLELIEHVEAPEMLLREMAGLLAPGGSLFLSTLNRTPMAFATAIIGAEYVAGLLPRGTHDYARFIRPAELAAWLRGAGLQLSEIAGLAYDPLRRRASITRSTAVNYLVRAEHAV